MSTKESQQNRSVGQIVERRVELFEKYTKLESSYKIQELCYSDIHLGIPLGKGTYSNVYRASLRDNPTKSYALKRLSPDIPRDKRDFKTGSVDLALESKLLEKLNHPNLIKVHGVKSGNICESVEEGNYFVLLDLLTETLEDRIETWQTSYKRNLFRRDKTLVSRVDMAALGIARGMQYLHKQGIIFRDLKPQNVGFSPDGLVKIFDLGIARDVQQCLATNQKLGFAGTPRYMAPEVGNGEVYDLSADIYSFGILLWEICTLQRPFSKMSTLGDYQKMVVEQGMRPQVNKIKHAGLRDLITACWSDYPHLRPSFRIIVGILEEICGHVKAPSTPVKLSKIDNDQRTSMLLSDALTEAESMVEGMNIRVNDTKKSES
jgi:serine/threonine protein kinase